MEPLEPVKRNELIGENHTQDECVSWSFPRGNLPDPWLTALRDDQTM